MAKAKTFKSNHDDPITIAVPGREPITFEPGKAQEIDDPDVIAVLSVNPDLEVVKKKSERTSDER